MASLLDEVVDAHGGLDRWNQLEQVHAHLIQGGVVWALKGHPGQLGRRLRHRESAQAVGVARAVPFARFAEHLHP